MPGKTRFIIKRDNPGVEIDVTDQMLKLFTDVAGLQSECKGLVLSIERLWRVLGLGMTGGFGLITALIVIL